MGTGYVRNDTANDIADAGVINADDLDGEFDAILAAFVAATGHTHDGAPAEGGAITVVGPAQDFVGASGDFSPKTDSAYDLGKTAVRWATGYLDDLVLTTALPVAQGGTGATSAGAARTALGVVIGANVQAYDAQLDDIAALAVTNGNIIVGDGSSWVAESGSTARTSLGLAIGSDVQAYDSVLDNTTASYTSAEETKLSGIEAGADVTDVTNVTAAGALMTSEVDADLKTFALPANTTISAFGKTLVDDANAAAALLTLGVSSTAAELNILEGVTATAAELNYVDGVTSSIQTQLDTKAPLDSPTFTGFPRSVTTPLGDSTTRTATTAFVDRAIPAALNASGSAPLYACRAWVNFDGTGTVAIRDSGNVSSITDFGVGDYRVNFATGMQDNDYAVSGITSGQNVKFNLEALSTGAVRVRTRAGSFGDISQDQSTVCIAIFR